MRISAHITETVTALLRERRIVVWYDPDCVFCGCFESLQVPSLTKVDASSSTLLARREADRAWQAILDVETPRRQAACLLIYIPWERGPDETGRRGDPFEPFALVGAAFGALESERLRSMARRVLTGREAEVDRLFAEGVPTLAQLDALAGGTRYPLLVEVLGTDVPDRVATRLLCCPQEVADLGATSSGLLAELQRLLGDAFGLEPEACASIEALSAAFGEWLLFSEFVFDIPGALPRTVAHVPRASSRFQEAVFDLCESLRTSSTHRDQYRDLAFAVERRLGLHVLAETTEPLGHRDTFPFEDHASLLQFQRLALEGSLAAARALAEHRRTSVWRSVPERDQLWRLAERCLDLLECGEAWQGRAVGASRPVADHVRAYCAEEEGMWRVDQAQRLVEQAAAVLAAHDNLAPLLEHVRERYRAWLGDAQAAFLESVARGGWPPEGFLRHTQAWSRGAAGPVGDGRRTAWFLVDALRYEMGRELKRNLESLGTAKVEPLCGVVPAATPFGMAALLPQADTTLEYRMHGDVLAPFVCGRPVISADDRRSVFEAVLGDRFRSLRLGELLTAGNARLRQEIGAVQVVAVFSTEIDDLGEHGDPLAARRYISDVVADLLAAASRLVGLGFERLVFVADHGFIQLPEILPGDRCGEPSGTWVMHKRRALLGTLGGRLDGVVVLDAQALGIQGPVEQVCVPRGVKVFRAACPYFHEGISLQECLVPLVSLEADRRAPDPEPDRDATVEIYYRSDRFTSRIFSVDIEYTSIAGESLLVRVEAFEPGTITVVGTAVDCGARDPHTHLVTLPRCQRIQVPIALDPDFSGAAVEVRVSDATTRGRTHASKTLRNAALD